MNKLDALEELLPGFQRFLDDLTTCKLSSALGSQVDKYNQNIHDYIEQHCTVPASRAPDPPKFTNGSMTESKEDFLAKQRELSRLSHTVNRDDSYYNVNVGIDAGNTSQGMDEYEAPTLSPSVPSSMRPPRRIVNDDLDFYENPDEIEPPRQLGKASTMPLPSKFTRSDQEGSDSGGTLMSFQSSLSSQNQEDLMAYEDLPDYENYEDGGDSFSSTDYEEYDNEQLGEHKTDANSNKTKSKSDDKAKMDKQDKLVLFQQQYEGEAEVDHLGVLFTPSKVMTLSKKALGKWGKRYCLARDKHLLCYKSPDSKRPALDQVLFGCTVSFVGQEGRQQNVFNVSHPNRGVDMFSAESKEDADKWIEVLKNYATMGEDLVPTTKEGEGQAPPTHTGDDLTKKLRGFFKREKKSKELSPQLSIDEKGVLSGYINVMGAKHGEPKWRKKFITIQKGCLQCYTEDGDTLQFEFCLNGTDMMPADAKACKRKMAMKIGRDNDTLIYVETLNHLDMGPLLKKFLEVMVPDQKKDESSTMKRGMVSSILRAFEKQTNEPGDQEFYDDVEVSSRGKAPAKGEQEEYVNFQVVFQQANRKKSEASLSPKVKKAEEAAPDGGKKDKKTKKKEEKKEKGKKDKKGKGKEEVVAKEVEEAPASPESMIEIVRKRPSVRVNKFQQSDKSHLLDVDRLQIERKDFDAKKREVTKRKVDLRTQKKETTDPKQKELLEAELQKAQQEWSEYSNRLAFIDDEIERFTKGGEASTKVKEKEDSASAEIVRNGISETKKNEPAGASSPGMEVAKRAGNVQDKLKMFRDMGNK